MCDRRDREVAVAGFDIYGPYDDPPMETFCSDCMRPMDQVLEVIITWKPSNAEAQWKKCRNLKPAFRRQK